MSDIYLNTAMTPAILESDAKTLARSPYTLAELRTILATEVHPVCILNLLVTAGAWTSFGEDWLQARILARQHSAWGWLHRLFPLHLLVRPQAERVFARVVALRNAGDDVIR